MKKILLSCVTCLLALGLVTACNNEDEDVSGDGGDSNTQDTGTGGGSDTGSGGTGSGGATDGTTQGGDTTETFVIEREGTVNVHIGAKNSGNALTSGVSLYAKAGHQWQEDYTSTDDSFPMVWDDSNHALVAATGSETDENLSAADLWYTVEGWSSVMPLELVIFGASSDDATDAYWTSYVLPATDVDGSGEENLNFWTTTQGSDHYAGLSLDWVSDETMEGVTDVYVVFTFDFSGVTTTGPYTTDVTWSVTTASITPEEGGEEE